MSDRDHYPPGVPCWVVNLQRDPAAALDFYGPLFGWEFEGSGGSPETFVARLRGRDVAGIAPLPPGRDDVEPGWVTHVRVDSPEETASKARDAGGALLDGPFEFPPAGRMAVLADPAGAVICAWEAHAREGAQLVNEPGAWAMSVLQTPDPDRATAFYGAVFGWETEAFGPATMWRLPGYVGGEPLQPVPRDVVAVMAPSEGGAVGWGVNFWVSDTDATADHAARLGGRVVVPPHDEPGFRDAVLADPQGAVFAISQLVAGPGGRKRVGRRERRPHGRPVG